MKIFWINFFFSLNIFIYRHYYNQNLTENDEKLFDDLPVGIRKQVLMNIKIKVINSIEIFKNSSEEFKKEIAHLLLIKEFALDETITSIGEDAGEVYFINKGSVRVEDKNKKLITRFKEGDFFGERALLHNEKRNASITAETFCNMYVLKKKNFLKILNKHNHFKKNIKKEIDKRT